MKQTLSFGNSTVSDLVQSSFGVPGRLHIGDIDADGYPDLLVTAKFTKDSKEITQTAIFMNSAPSLSPEQVQKKNGINKDSRREFFEQINDYKLHDLTKEVSTAAVFMDIDEDGRIDVLLQRKSTKGDHTDLLCIYNNYVKDTFFLKALMVNTLDQYGNALSGPSYRLVVTDLNDNKFVIIGS